MTALLVAMVPLSVHAATTATTVEHRHLRLVSQGPDGGNGAFDSQAAHVSADGSTVVFNTAESLVAEDTDGQEDAYVWRDGHLDLASIGPDGGNFPFHTSGAWAVSDDGSKVFLTTSDNLVGDDDGLEDIYQWSNGVVTLVSTGPFQGGVTGPIGWDGMSSDGDRVFFTTVDSYSPADTDTVNDVYERANGETTLLSVGSAGGNADLGAGYVASSADGSRVYFATSESLVPDDTDTSLDIYGRHDDTTSLLSSGPDGGNGAVDVRWEGMSADGSHVFFSTTESLVSADTDAATDVYASDGTTTTLVSSGQTGGNGPDRADYYGATPDGSHVYFETTESLVPQDLDSSVDVYEHVGSTTRLVSTGPADTSAAGEMVFRYVSHDGRRVYFVSPVPLTAGDTDSQDDVYVRIDGSTSRRVMPTNGNADANIFGASANGRHVFLYTSESQTSDDTDDAVDVYDLHQGHVTRVSRGNGPFDSSYLGSSANGALVLFETREPLVSTDTDASRDLYLSALAPPALRQRPQVTGVPTLGRRLTCTPGRWANAPTRFTFTWQRDGAVILGATGRRHEIVRADVGHLLRCRVTATNDAGSRTASGAAVRARRSAG